MKCTSHPFNTLENYKYADVITFYNGQWLLSKHKERTSWETQGGHIEQGETPFEAAKRELYEESGAIEFDIEPLCDYSLVGMFNWKDVSGNSQVYIATVYSLDAIPQQSEIEKICLFDTLPEDLTYPEVTSEIMPLVLEWLVKNTEDEMPKYIVREITPADYPKLDDFLCHAIFIPEGGEHPAYDVIFQSEIYVYVKDFGGKNDCGVVAEIKSQLVGAAWARIIPAYGNIDDKTPKLAISTLPEYRGKGIGTDLMSSLFVLLKERGYVRTSLSVQQDNPAVRFYKRLGYVVTDEKKDHAGHDDFIMVKNLQSE